MTARSSEFQSRYGEAFQSPASLVPQDSGCCNIHVEEGRAIFFDWADVVIGHPVFSCDRLLDQVPPERQDAVIGAFCEPLRLDRECFNAMRRSGVLHEVLRYHDELEHLPVEEENHDHLMQAVQSQLKILVEFEAKRP